jgi:AraC-like DNA-binding protein
MWSHRIVASSDPDEFVTLIRPTGADILVTERGSFHGRSVLMDIGRLYLQQRREKLARVLHVELPRPGILFLAEPGPSMFLNGVEVGPEHLALFSAGIAFVSRLSGPTCWAGMTLSNDDMQAICPSYFGSRQTWTDSFAIITPPPGALSRLRSLHAMAGALADTSAELFLPLDTESALEQALVRAMLACIEATDLSSVPPGVQHQQIIIRRFREMLDVDSLMPLRVPQTSQAIGTSARTLRLACQTQFGVSPTQYLLLRRMRLARRALREADPEVTGVTTVATGLGFWELGRFSVRYRQIFGESPSTTLRSSGRADN